MSCGDAGGETAVGRRSAADLRPMRREHSKAEIRTTPLHFSGWCLVVQHTKVGEGRGGRKWEHHLTTSHQVRYQD